MALKNTPLSVKERATLIRRLQDEQPNYTEAEADAFVTWAENVRCAQSLLEAIEMGEVHFLINEKGHVVIGKPKGQDEKRDGV